MWITDVLGWQEAVVYKPNDVTTAPKNAGGCKTGEAIIMGGLIYLGKEKTCLIYVHGVIIKSFLYRGVS